MTHPRLSGDEIVERGQTLYDGQIRAHVETPANVGKQIVIDVESGEYEIDEDGLAASLRMLARSPDAALYGIRIGYDVVYSLGGAMTPTKPA